MIDKTSKLFVRSVNKYLLTDFKGCFSTLEKLSQQDLSIEQRELYECLLLLFFSGHLMGESSFSGVLQSYGITSSSGHVSYKRLIKNLKINVIRAIFNSIFENIVSTTLCSILSKSASTFSRKEIVAVLDDSIFQHFLSQTSQNDPEIAQFYGSWFSGQYQRVVKGYKVMVFGLTIEGIFYPLYIDFVPKIEATSTKEAATAAEKAALKKEQGSISTKIVLRLFKKWAIFVEKLKNQGFTVPVIPFSCDSGYCRIDIENACEGYHLLFISVPKVSQKMKIEWRDYTVKELKDAYVKAEKRYLENNKQEKKIEPFVQRKRAYCHFLKKEVTILIFRVSDSKKVTLIISTDIHIFAKTLRRAFFQRTLIEQFFRIIKHTLKFRETKTSNKIETEIKVLEFAFLAIQVQKFVKFIRKRIKICRKMGFQQIVRQIRRHMQGIETVISLLKTKPFASEKKAKKFKINKL
jgi:hypothetical protein